MTEPDEVRNQRVSLRSKESVARDEGFRQGVNLRPRASVARRSDREDEALTRAVVGVPEQMQRADLPVVNTRTDQRVFCLSR